MTTPGTTAKKRTRKIPILGRSATLNVLARMRANIERRLNAAMPGDDAHHDLLALRDDLVLIAHNFWVKP